MEVILDPSNLIGGASKGIIIGVVIAVIIIIIIVVVVIVVVANQSSATPTPDDTGSDDAGSDDAGSDDTGSDDAGSDDTGSDDTGSDDTGSDDTACYTVSSGKDWSGTYSQSTDTYNSKPVYITSDSSYYLVWDGSSFWTFLTSSQYSDASSGTIAATDRTAIVNDNNGIPENSTGIFDWINSDATGTYSSSC